MNPSFEFNPLGVLRLLRSAGGAICAQAALHSQLARVEWAEEKIRLARIAIAALAALISAICLLLLGSLIALALSWNTPYQTPAISAVLVLYLLSLSFAIRTLARQIALGALSFAATREEIAADLAMLKAKL
jgi:uncharacterized membrane protein YqjE